MTYASDTFNGDGSTTEFTLTFDFIQRDHVNVSRIDKTTKVVTTLSVVTSGQPTGDQYIWETDNRIKVGTPPTAAEDLLIVRDTPENAQIVVWKDGSYIVAEDLNTSDKQWLYNIQELEDQIDLIDGGVVGSAVKQVTGTSPVQVDNTDIQRPLVSVDAITKAEAQADPANPAWDNDDKVGTVGAIDCIYKQIVGDGANYPAYGGKGKLGQIRIDNTGATPKLFYWDANAATPAWVEIQVGGSQGVPEAPDDGKTYGRKSKAWAEISSSGGGIVYKGTRDLTQPAPAAVAGDFYVNSATSGTVDNSWTGLGGQALTGAERVVYDGSVWEMLPMPPAPPGTVTSVNGKLGPTVVLNAADVDAVPLGSWAAIPQLTNFDPATGTIAQTTATFTQGVSSQVGIQSTSTTRQGSYSSEVCNSACLSSKGFTSTWTITPSQPYGFVNACEIEICPTGVEFVVNSVLYGPDGNPVSGGGSESDPYTPTASGNSGLATDFEFYAATLGEGAQQITGVPVPYNTVAGTYDLTGGSGSGFKIQIMTVDTVSVFGDIAYIVKEENIIIKNMGQDYQANEELTLTAGDGSQVVGKIIGVS